MARYSNTYSLNKDYKSLLIWEFETTTRQRIGTVRVVPNKGLNRQERYDVLAARLVSEGITPPKYEFVLNNRKSSPKNQNTGLTDYYIKTKTGQGIDISSYLFQIILNLKKGRDPFNYTPICIKADKTYYWLEDENDIKDLDKRSIITLIMFAKTHLND